MDIQILKACATGWQGKQGKQYKVFREAWVSWFINSTLVMHCLVLSMMCIKMVCTNPSAPEEDHPLPVVILIAFTVVIAMRWLLKACNLPQYILSVNYAIRYFEAFYFIAFILGYVQSDLIIHNKVMVPLVDVNMALMDGVGLQITVPQALAFFPLRVVVMIYAVSAIQGCNMAAVSHSLEAQVSNIQACSWPGDLSAAQLFQIFGSTITFLAVSFGHEYRCCKEFLRKQMFSVEATRSRSSSLNPRSVLGSFTEGSDVANVALMAAPAGPSCMAASVLPSIMAASVMPSSMAPAEEPSVIAAQEEPSSLPSIMAAPEVPSVMAASVMPSTIASQEEPSFLPSIMAAPEVPSIMAASVMPSTIAAQEEPSALPSVMAALEVPSVISEPEEPFDELTDEQIYDMIDAIKNGTYGALAMPKHHTLRIPDADPDNLPPDAKIKLKEKFQAENPGYIVTDIVFHRGSLLVGVRIRPHGSRSTDASGSADASAAHVLKAVKHCSWLAWLGLPASMDTSTHVYATSERRTDLLCGMPLAVTFPKSEEGVRVVSLPLRYSELPTGVAIKASLGNQILECDFVQPGVEEIPYGSLAEQGCITLQVMLPIDTLLCELPCRLLNVIVQDLGDKVIVGDRTVVLLNEALAVLEPELCGLRLLRPQDMPHGLKTAAVEQPWGADIVYALGLWLQNLHAEHQLPGGVTKDWSDEVDPVISQKLADLWRAGNRLLMLLVGKGCTDSAKHLIDLLLKSPALQACVPGGWTESLEDTPSSHDFIGGTQNTQGCSLMHLAVFNGSYAMLDEVMRWSVVYNLPSMWDTKDKHGMTPLHIARLVKDGQVAKYLLHKGDPVILQSWNQGGAKKFSKHMAVMEAGMGRQSSNTTSIKPLPTQKLTHTVMEAGISRQIMNATSIKPLPTQRQTQSRGLIVSKPAPISSPAIPPCVASAGSADADADAANRWSEAPHEGLNIVPRSGPTLLCRGLQMMSSNKLSSLLHIALLSAAFLNAFLLPSFSHLRSAFIMAIMYMCGKLLSFKSMSRFLQLPDIDYCKVHAKSS